jgi:hypothetical protein
VVIGGLDGKAAVERDLARAQGEALEFLGRGLLGGWLAAAA